MARLDSEQDAYEDAIQERRRETVRRLVKLDIEDPPDARRALPRVGGGSILTHSAW